MNRRLVIFAACATLCAALAAWAGALASVAGRSLGPRLDLDWAASGAIVLVAFAASIVAAVEAGGSRTQRWIDACRTLALAALAWPALCGLLGTSLERKRVLFLAALSVAFVAGTWLLRATISALGARRTLILAGAAAIVLAAGAGWAWIRPEVALPRPALDPASRHNLLLISVDTTRQDALGCYGSTRGGTPNIDALAAGGVRFENAIAQAPHTHPSMASLLTSRYPIEHGAVNGAPVLSRRNEVLAEHLARAGYRTAGFLDSPWLRPDFGFQRGYEDFNENTHTGEIQAWLKSHKHERFFLHLHYLEAHGPYLARAPWIDRFSPGYTGPWERVDGHFLERAEIPGRADLDAETLERFRALYESGIAAMDQKIGAVLDTLAELGLENDTLVILVADHGEEFLEHGSLNHSHTVYDELIRVPLIARLPGALPAGVRVSEQVELIDVVPTALELLRCSALAGARGRSLLGLLDGSRPAGSDSRVSFSQRHDLFGRHAISARSKQWKLHVLACPTGPHPLNDWDCEPASARAFLWRNDFRLFDLSQDPGETRDVAGLHPEVVAELTQSLRDWRKQHDAGIPLGMGAGADLPQVSEEVMERLRQLGYAGAAEAIRR